MLVCLLKSFYFSIAAPILTDVGSQTHYPEIALDARMTNADPIAIFKNNQTNVFKRDITHSVNVLYENSSKKHSNRHFLQNNVQSPHVQFVPKIFPYILHQSFKLR